MGPFTEWTEELVKAVVSDAKSRGMQVRSHEVKQDVLTLTLEAGEGKTRPVHFHIGGELVHGEIQ